MSENPQDKNPTGDFVPVEDKAEAEGLVREALRTQAPAILWTDNKAHVFKTQIHQKPGPNGTFHSLVPENVDHVQMTGELAAKGSSHVFFSISLAHANIFFKTRYLGFQGNLMQFDFPQKVFRVQRRKDMRLHIRDGYTLKAEFPSAVNPQEILSKKVFDISASGMAILVEPEEAGDYTVNRVIQNLTFTINARKIVVNAIVRHCIQMRHRPNCKVGLEFQKLPAADTQQIAKYVFDENIKFVSRFL